MKKLLISFIFVVSFLTLIACSKTVYVKEINLEFSQVSNEEDIDKLRQVLELDHIDVEVLDYIIDKTIIYKIIDYRTRTHYLVIDGDETLIFEYLYLDKIYEIDSDGNKIPEIFILTDIGSGLRIPYAMHVDLEDYKSTVSIVGRNDGQLYKDPIVLVAEELSIKVYPYYSEFDRIGPEPIGQLAIDETIDIKVGE